MRNDIFKDLYGYENIKEELLIIRSWFKNPSILNNEKVSLIKGIIFYGPFGCGKTMFMKKFAESFDCPIYTVNSTSSISANNDIRSAFMKAKNDDFAIILIDEIDLLINKDPLSYKELKEEMDGINSKGKILVMGTTNYVRNLPSPLLRPGRFDRKIRIGLPNENVRKIMFKKYMTKLKMDDSNVDINTVGTITIDCKCSDIKAITNDVFLFAKNKPTTEDFSRSYERIMFNSRSDNKQFIEENVAVHEVGHMLMGLRFNKNYRFYNIKFNKNGGETVIHPVNDDDTIEKRKESIMIALSGHIAEELIYNEKHVGSASDFQRARDLASRLVERTCIRSLKDYLGVYDSDGERYDPYSKKEKIEKTTDKLLKELEKDTYKYLKKNIKLIKYYSKLLMEKGYLKSDDIKGGKYE